MRNCVSANPDEDVRNISAFDLTDHFYLLHTVDLIKHSHTFYVDSYTFTFI